MPEWNDYQKKILDECKKLLTAGKVYHYSLSMEELNGMKKVMIHLTGKVDIPLLWKLSFAIRNSSSCFFAGRQLLRVRERDYAGLQIRSGEYHLEAVPGFLVRNISRRSAFAKE